MSNTDKPSVAVGHPGLAGDVGSAGRTQYPQSGPITMGDQFTRGQIIEYLERIPLGYETQRDHEILERFVTRAQRHFLELDAMWEPSND